MRRRALLSGSNIDYSTQYLTFTALESGTFSLVVPASVTSTEITGGVSYSTDNGATWTTTTITSSAQTITTPTINAGGKVLWKAVARRFASSYQNYCKFRATGNFDVSGNIMSLLYGDDFIGQTAFRGYNYIMRGLFYGNTKVKSAENLILLATRLYNGCYSNMFNGCTSLTTAPELPATTLKEECYSSMFYACTSLNTAPELPATTLANSCYRSMFSRCTSLNSITCLATNISATDCTNSWVNNVAANGTFTKAASMSGWTTGTDGIPEGWTVANVYEYVDLGLPSGTKWATMNVGATSETDYGNYYQYGKGAAQYAATSGDSNYSGTEDPLDSSVDTAAQVWGGSWHMPTRTQMQELTANTTYQWVTDYKGSGINGGTFTAANGNYVFFPATGLWLDGSQYDVGSSGYYWGSSPDGSSSAYGLYFSSGNKVVYDDGREGGYAVRPVVG